MNKNLFIVVLCLLMAFVTVSCEKEPVHEHAYTAEWKSDAINHWHECSCGEKSDTAAHTWGEVSVATSSSGSVEKYACTVCEKNKEHTYSYKNIVKVETVNELITALEGLKESTCIIMTAGTYDFEGKSTNVNYSGQTGWMMPILKNNVMIKAADGATVKICSTDNIGNGALATQDIMIVAGENFVLDGITVGVRGNKNKSIEVISNNAVFKNCKFVDEACLYIAKGDTSDLKGYNTTVSNCTFEKDSSISFTNGANILKMKKNTFKDDSIIYLTGKRDSGWNPNSINVFSIDWTENVFEAGATMILKATDADWSTSFGEFAPTTFGLTLESNVDPVEGGAAATATTLAGTYNARIKTYVKK